jgi:hypothetical protein
MVMYMDTLRDLSISSLFLSIEVLLFLHFEM